VIQESYDRIHLLIALTDPVDDPHEFFKRELMELSRVIRLSERNGLRGKKEA
jgi:hypothetical protein